MKKRRQILCGLASSILILGPWLAKVSRIPKHVSSLDRLFFRSPFFSFESDLVYLGYDLTNIDTNPRRAPRITRTPPIPPETIPSTNSTIAHTKIPTDFDPITQIAPIIIATILYIALLM